jgi:hypothetical protein
MPKCSHYTNYKIDYVFTQVEKKGNPPKGYACFSALCLNPYAKFCIIIVLSILKALKIG